MKKNMFKILASALCFTLFLSCVGCNEKEETSEQPENVVPSVGVVEGEYLYQRGVSEYSVLNPDDATT